MNDLTPTVFIVDDDPSVLKALTRLMSFAGLNAATFASPHEFLDHHDQNAPGCLVLDVSMPHINGLELHQMLVAKGCDLPVIFLTGHGDIPMTVRAIKQGAVNFLTKPVRGKDLIAAIHDAIETNRVARQARAKLNELQQRLAILTPREREVLSHVVTGKRNKQIADELGTAEKTIKIHRASVMKKLQAESLADLMKLTEPLVVMSSSLD
jgi:RNA polymerase sigma factor (sigma-70 family)